MVEGKPGQDSLVLYKQRPARVTQAGDRLTLELEDGRSLKVRPKDVVLLHPGPLHRLDELQPPAGEVQTAWELLAGQTTHLAELAVLIYGAYTPATAWATWQLIAEGLYFTGTPNAVTARPGKEVAHEQAVRAARAAAAQDWQAFLNRARAGQWAPGDRRYLADVENLALARQDRSYVLRALGRAERPESAHALLLEAGYWSPYFNPYPHRLGLPVSPPPIGLPALPAEERADLTHLPALAIDDEGNQDPDDALSLDGHRLWVHVADVAALVHPDSPADLEARQRGATLYLPEGMVPMLPLTAIQTLGLGLNQVSPALSFGLDLDAYGEITALTVTPSWVRVTRLTYEEAETRLTEEPLPDLLRLARASEARRRARGAIQLDDLPEVKIRVRDGQVHIQPVRPLQSRVIVREAMLLAGEALARLALAQDIPLPFTTQDPPDTPGQPTDLAGMYALRRALKPGQPGSLPGPHAGLGLEVYVQATSPLRRYLDLVVHQQLRAHLRGADLLGPAEVLERVGAAAAVTASVRQAERYSRQHWTLVYLMQHPDWRGPGVLVELYDRRGTVLIPELDWEARLPLPRDWPLNTTLLLTVREINLPELSAYFQISD